MPLIRTNVAGSEIIASGQSVRRWSYTQGPGLTGTSELTIMLQVNNLPRCFIWINQTAGLAGCSFEPLYAVDNVTSGGVIIPNWLPLVSPQLIILGTPQRFPFEVPATMLSINVITPAGAFNSTFEIVLGAVQ